MKTLLFQLFLLCQMSIIAQTIVPDNCIWSQKFHSVIWGHGGIISETTYYNTYQTLGDTIIGDSSYLKMYKNQLLNGLVLSREQKVFYGPHPDSLYLMFDYGLMVGDTFTFNAPNYPTPLKSFVTKIDTLSIKGINRKRIQFNNFNGYGMGPQWIEGIGDVNFGGIETDYSYVVYNNNTTVLVCFSQDNNKIYGLCTLGIQNKTKQLLFYPNPTQDYIKIDLSRIQKPAIIRLMSTNGISLIEYTAIEAEYTLDLTRLNAGIYILQLSDGKDFICNKIVKL